MGPPNIYVELRIYVEVSRKERISNDVLIRVGRRFQYFLLETRCWTMDENYHLMLNILFMDQ